MIIEVYVLHFVKKNYWSYILGKSKKERILKQARSNFLHPLELLHGDLCSLL